MSGNQKGVKKFNNANKMKYDSNESTTTDEKNPILKTFAAYAKELDAKHDRYERIVKLSRDITIESKRIIFLLHTIDEKKQNNKKILNEAERRLKQLIDVNFKSIAKELINQDPYQYRGAYSGGLQEFIEAYSYMEFFKWADLHKKTDNLEPENVSSLSDWLLLQKEMRYQDVLSEDSSKETSIDPSVENNKSVKFDFFVDPTEYILGLSDLTGELMRRCVNSLGCGETDVCMQICKVLQDFYTGYISLTFFRSRDLPRKITTMRQSVLKAENVCYNIRVRGSEAAKRGATVLDNKQLYEVDEGFY